MTKEAKELLLKELCSRLPYGVKGRVYAEDSNGEYDINGDMIFFDSPYDVTLDIINTSTEEIHVIAIGNEDTVDFIEQQQAYGDPYTIDGFKPYLRPMSSMTEEEKEEKFQMWAWKSFDWEVVDWLNKHHFDYHGLIEKGLALEAPEDMYKTE